MKISRTVFVSLFVILISLAVYWQVRKHAFINFDDPSYLTHNQLINTGFNVSGIKRAFSVVNSFDYWLPLTYLSHMLDCQLFGLDPGKHHLINVLLHILSSLLLFFLFQCMTGAFWQSALLGILFAVWPLNVESVAWAAQRKNILSFLFWMLTMMAYLNYIQKPSVNRYVLMICLYSIGLLAKPTLIMLPLVLLLMDYWPLERLRIDQPKDIIALLDEKLPLFILALLSFTMSILFFSVKGWFATNETVPFALRMSQAPIIYFGYIIKIIFPVNLTIIEPSGLTAPLLWQSLTTFFFLVLIIVTALVWIKKKPWFFVGWFWCGLNLLPAGGLFQFKVWAKFYPPLTYVPIVGFLIMIIWEGGFRLKKLDLQPAVLLLTAMSIIMVCTLTAWHQVGFWKNSFTLFEHSLEVAEHKWMAHKHLGGAYDEIKETNKAILHFSKSLKLNPHQAGVHINLGRNLKKNNQTDKARQHYVKALELDPRSAEAHNNLGNAFMDMGKTRTALSHYSKALDLQPSKAVIHNNLGIALAAHNRLASAILHFKKAWELDLKTAHKNLIHSQKQLQGTQDLITKILKVLVSNPKNPEAHYQLAKLYLSCGNYLAAREYFQKTLAIQPEFLPAILNLAAMLAELNEIDKAAALYQKAVQIRPAETAVIYYNLACLYSVAFKTDIALQWLEQAVEHGFSDQLKLKIDPDLNNIRKTTKFSNLLMLVKVS